MKFSIRDLFLVTVIVALGLGWWVDRRRLAEELWELSVQRFSREVKYQGFRVVPLPNSQAPAPNPPKP